MLSRDDLRRRADGTFFVRPYLGTNAVTGKPLRPYKSFPEAADADEALAMANEWYATIATAAELGVPQRLGDLLMRYVDFREAEGVSPNTARAYRAWVRNYVDPYIGDMDPDDVRPVTVGGLYNALMLRGARDGGGVAPSTVTGLHWMLSGAWKWMVRNDACACNPMLSVGHPRAAAREAAALSAADFRRVGEAIGRMLRKSAEGRDVFARNAAMAAYLALMDGERVGEACGHMLSDARTALGVMHVGGSVVEARGGVWRRPSTKGGRSRNVALAPEACAELDAHIGWQRSYLAPAVAADPSRPLLTVAGGWMRPTKVSAWFSSVRDEMGLPKGVTFHTLRHTHATWLLMGGADMRTIQERLGHADVATTLRVYSHVMPGRDAEAARAFAAMARGGGSAGIR